MSAFTDISEYALKEDATWTLLFDITRRDAARTTLHISDAPYATTPDDEPYMLSYTVAIGGDGLRELRRSLPDAFSGVATCAFGSVTVMGVEEVAYTTPGGAYLINPEGDRWLINPAGDVFAYALNISGLGKLVLNRGAEIKASIAAPRRYFRYSTARVLLLGEIARISGGQGKSVTIDLTDKSGALRNARITVGNVPICLGICRNVTPKLVNPAISEYAVHDGHFGGIDALFDDASLIEPTLYTVSPLTGRFRLNGFAPVGKLTATVRGAVVDGEWLSSTQQIIEHLLVRTGQEVTRAYGDLPTSAIGLYLTESVSLGDTLTELMRGCAGYWTIDKVGVFRANLVPIPGEVGEIAGTTTVLDNSVNWEEDARLYKNVSFTYCTNWTQLQPRAAATTEMATFVQAASKSGVVNLDSMDPELLYADGETLRTFFDEEPAAFSAATRLLRTFGKIRYRVSAALPYSQERELGDAITLDDGEHVFRGYINDIVDVRGTGYPQQKIGVFA